MPQHGDSEEQPARRPVVRYYKPSDPPIDMIHIERDDYWANFSLGGKLLSTSKSKFPPENRAVFEEIDEAEAARIAPLLVQRVKEAGKEPTGTDNLGRGATDCPKCGASMTPGGFCVKATALRFILALWSWQSLWFIPADPGQNGGRVEVLKYGDAVSGWRCEACGTSVILPFY